MRGRFFVFCLLAALAPAAFPLYAQEAATEQTAKPPTQLEAMQKIEDSWSTAIAKRDQFGLELVLAPQFINIAANGDVSTRNQQIATDISANTGLISLEQKVVTVRTLGDIALVNGTYILRHKQGSSAVDEKGIFTHVFQKTRSNWQCINAQRTIVTEAGVQKAKAQSSQGETARKSNAELPFHIPLFHKGAESAANQTPSGDPQQQETTPQ